MPVPVLRHALALVAVASVSIAAQAQAPGNAKAVQIIVPFGPGGGQDMLVVVQRASAENSVLCLQTPDGPPLQVLELPYRIPALTESTTRPAS